MTKLPAITGNAVVKALGKNGWVVKSQKGSHVKLTKAGVNYFLIVPIHKKTTIPKGTLSNIIRDAGLSIEEFVNLL
jgi:predicted RNA binding protein YcfA (HicA-like mRNA interferase family)